MDYSNYDKKVELTNEYIDELCIKLINDEDDEKDLQAWDNALRIILTEVQHKKDTVHNLLNHIYESYRVKTKEARQEGKPTLYELMVEAMATLNDFDNVYKAEYTACKALLDKEKEENNEN